MIKIALVDDDSDFIDYASKTIYKMLETDIVIDTFTTVDTFALAIKDNFYHIIILDYDLTSGITGFSIIENLNYEYDLIIIMVTSYTNTDIMSEAFEYKIYRYIFKQSFEDKIAKVFDAAISEIRARLQTLTVKDKQNTYHLRINDLYCVYSESYYVIFQLKNYNIRIRMSLKDVTDLLLLHHFVHAKSNTLVNIYHVIRFNNAKVYLDNGSSCLLSRTGYKEMSIKFNKYRV